MEAFSIPSDLCGVVQPLNFSNFHPEEKNDLQNLDPEKHLTWFFKAFEVDWMKHVMDIFGGVYSYDSYLQVIPHENFTRVVIFLRSTLIFGHHIPFECFWLLPLAIIIKIRWCPGRRPTPSPTDEVTQIFRKVAYVAS